MRQIGALIVGSAIVGLAIAPGLLEGADFGAAAAYPHLHPKHVALACRECHLLKANETDLHEMPGHATCTSCHNFAEEAVKNTESFCGECHTSIRATKENPALFAFPRQHARQDFGDEFSHVAHKNAGTSSRCEGPGAGSQSQCSDCHAPAHPTPAAAQPDKQMEASHAFCFACHCENPRGYTDARKNLNPSRNDCAVCHLAHEAEVTRFTEVRDFRHVDHLFDTRPRKKSAGPVSHDPDLLCVECHKTAVESRHLADIREPAAATCRTCHTGKVGLPDPLPSELLAPLESQP
jgi:hypothetical protein